MKILEELSQYKNWVCWKYVNETKRVYSDLREPRWGDPKLWKSYTEACELKEKGNFDGIGFVITPDCPFTVIDIDRCFKDGKLIDGKHFDTENIKNIIKYKFPKAPVLYSPSKTGLHVWIKGKPKFKLNRGSIDHKVEIYGGKHFMTFTGNLLRDGNLIDYQEDLDTLVKWAELPRAKKARGSKISTGPFILNPEIGSRNSYLTCMAGHFRNLGIKDRDVLKMLLLSLTAHWTEKSDNIENEIDNILNQSQHWKSYNEEKIEKRKEILEFLKS